MAPVANGSMSLALSYLIGCSHLASVLPLNARAGTVHYFYLFAVTFIGSACKHFYRKYFYCKSLLAQVTSISTEAIYQLLDQDMSVTEVPAFLMFLESELSSLKSSQIQHDMFATFEDADTFLQKAIGRFLKVNVQHTSFRELVIRQGLTYKLADRRHASIEVAKSVRMIRAKFVCKVGVRVN
ncbi:hypothetical protein BGX38DRAFT_1146289 [Terfezia claveryi]|nr:hypothetical protein BGX38DRAFT_1146289 [Terfezia claveryi]